MSADVDERVVERRSGAACRRSRTTSANRVQAWNENPKPFIWTKTAELILESLARLLQRIDGGGQLAPLAPLGRRTMHVRVKFFDGRRDARDTAGYPFGGQPHSGFRRAKCPHLADIREGQAARPRTDLPGSDEGCGPAGSRRSGHPALPTGSARSSEAHTNRQQRC